MMMRLMAGCLVLFTGSAEAVGPAEDAFGSLPAEQVQQALSGGRADATEDSHTTPPATERIRKCISRKQSWIECYKEVHGDRIVFYTTAYFPNTMASADRMANGLWLYKSIDFEKLKAALSTTTPTTSE